MARIPIERRRDGGGPFWLLLTLAVLGVVGWLVHEWFDDDYYNDYAASSPLRSLAPLASGEGWRSYVDRRVDVQGLRVVNLDTDHTFTVDVNGRPVTVVAEPDDLRGVVPGAMVDVPDGRVMAVDDDQLLRLGLEPSTLQQGFVIQADDVEVAG